MTASKMKNKLKKMCWCHVICLNTPPQEQGRCAAYFSINVMYPVNSNMSNRNPYNAGILVDGKVSNNAINNSIIGKAIATPLACSAIKGERDN